MTKKLDVDAFSKQICDALRSSFSELFAAHPDERFYVCGVFTDDSLQFAYPVANSEEALATKVQHYQKKVDPKYGTNSNRNTMRWSYGDWGYFPNIGKKHFAGINKKLQKNFDAPEEEFELQIGPLWNALFGGFSQLEREKFFGKGKQRSQITLLVVGDLPEELVETFAKELNPPKVFENWKNWDFGAPE